MEIALYVALTLIVLETIYFQYTTMLLRDEVKRTQTALKIALEQCDNLDQKWVNEKRHNKADQDVFESFRSQVSKREQQQIELYQRQVEAAVADARSDALKRSRSVMRGQATEHLAPLMQSEWAYKDLRFIGNPIDYLICAGSSAISDGEQDTIDEVVLLDIKTGKSNLSKVQRRVRDAVKEGRVCFATYNTDTQELRRWI